MKDVGLDFGEDFGFGVDPNNSENQLNQSLNSSTVSGSSFSDIGESDSAPNSLPLPQVISEQNITVATSLPQQNSFPPVPTQGTSGQAPQQVTAVPQIVFNTMHVASPAPQVPLAPVTQPAPQSLQLVQMSDRNFQLQYNSVLQHKQGSAGPPTTSTSQQAQLPPKPTPRAPPRTRNLASDPTRTTRFEDMTLPGGWYRRVSQRKSGASAGRYDVFIIGPSGKRFRSRNELKTFFEKTGETTLNPDDFDFSTFGRNNPKMPLSNQATLASSNPRRPPLSCFQQPPRPSLGGDQAGNGQWLPPINLDKFNDEQTFASQLESSLDTLLSNFHTMIQQGSLAVPMVEGPEALSTAMTLQGKIFF